MSVPGWKQAGPLINAPASPYSGEFSQTLAGYWCTLMGGHEKEAENRPFVTRSIDFN